MEKNKDLTWEEFVAVCEGYGWTHLAEEARKEMELENE